jgi:hypothetical protein
MYPNLHYVEARPYYDVDQDGPPLMKLTINTSAGPLGPILVDVQRLDYLEEHARLAKLELITITKQYPWPEPKEPDATTRETNPPVPVMA